MHLDGCSSTKARLMRYKLSLQKYTFTYCEFCDKIVSIKVIKQFNKRLLNSNYFYRRLGDYSRWEVPGWLT